MSAAGKAHVPSHYKLGAYDFSLQDLYRVSKTDDAKSIRRLDIHTAQLLTHFNGRWSDHFGFSARTMMLLSALEHVDDAGQELSPFQNDVVRQRQYRSYVQSQARFHDLVATGIFHDTLCKLPNLEIMSVQHEGDIKELTQCFPSPELENTVDKDGSELAADEPCVEYGQDGAMLVLALDALAQRAKKSSNSSLSELRIMIDTRDDLPSPYTVSSRHEILETLHTVRKLHFGSRMITWALGPEMSAVLSACTGVKCVTTEHWGETWSANGVEDPYSTHLTYLLKENPSIWPQLSELHFSRAEFDRKGLASFWEAHAGVLKRLTLSDCAMEDVLACLRDIVGSSRLRSLHLQELVVLWGHDSDLGERCYFSEGITAIANENQWLLSRDEICEARCDWVGKVDS